MSAGARLPRETRQEYLDRLRLEKFMLKARRRGRLIWNSIQGPWWGDPAKRTHG